MIINIFILSFASIRQVGALIWDPLLILQPGGYLIDSFWPFTYIFYHPLLSLSSWAHHRPLSMYDRQPFDSHFSTRLVNTLNASKQSVTHTHHLIFVCECISTTTTTTTHAIDTNAKHHLYCTSTKWIGMGVLMSFMSLCVRYKFISTITFHISLAHSIALYRFITNLMTFVCI